MTIEPLAFVADQVRSDAGAMQRPTGADALFPYVATPYVLELEKQLTEERAARRWAEETAKLYAALWVLMVVSGAIIICIMAAT